jgi:hypothetical protein
MVVLNLGGVALSLIGVIIGVKRLVKMNKPRIERMERISIR